MIDAPARLRLFLAGSVFVALPTLLACGDKKKPDTLPDAAIVMAPDAAPTVLTPDVDAAAAAEADADSGRKPVTLNTNVARLRLCCGQLHAQGYPIRSTPEGLVILHAATQCDALVAQAGVGAASVPELGVLKTALGNRTIPPLCKGF